MFKRILIVFLAILVVAGVVFALGPRPEADLVADFDASSIGSDVEAYIAEAENTVSDLREGMGKEVIWADPLTKAKTDVAVVYLHGFSASKEEIRPVPDLVAEALGANLYYARLAGHGRSGDAMAEATAKDWMNDLAESLAIGQQLGERILLITVSTGGTIAKAGYANDGLMDSVDGLVLISPNFKINNPAAPLLTMPWARWIVPAISGAERSFEPVNDLHARNWTTKYPTRALFPMAAMVRDAEKVKASDINVPALFMFDPNDKVISAETARAVAGSWSGPVEIIEVADNDDPFNHVIAGDSLSPSTTQSTADAITAWWQAL
jgi:esterase/lipase